MYLRIASKPRPIFFFSYFDLHLCLNYYITKRFTSNGIQSKFLNKIYIFENYRRNETFDQ